MGGNFGTENGLVLEPFCFITGTIGGNTAPFRFCSSGGSVMGLYPIFDTGRLYDEKEERAPGWKTGGNAATGEREIEN